MIRARSSRRNCWRCRARALSSSGRLGPCPSAGPTSKSLIDRVTQDADKLKVENPSAPIPVDLVTTSASGLDPDISPAAAFFQVPHVAQARGISEARLRELVNQSIEGRSLGILGEPRVNVLKLNMRLDTEQSANASR